MLSTPHRYSYSEQYLHKLDFTGDINDWKLFNKRINDVSLIIDPLSYGRL